MVFRFHGQGQHLRILHYNWVDPADPAGRGGGVRIYAQSLMDEQRRMGGHDCTALSSGMAYDLSPRANPRWQARGRGRFEFVNTRPVAPSHAEFAAAAQISNAATEALFREFLHKTGPYDVIHFHGLEGLPARVLALRKDLPNTRFVVSLHNYYPFCPQVNLWWQERAHCDDFRQGARCGTCLPVMPNPLAVRRAYAVEASLARFGAPAGSWPYERLLRPSLLAGWRALKAMRARKPAPPTPPVSHSSASDYAARRAEMVRLLNTYCDEVLAVSDRVRDIARGFGVTKTRTCYIGTRHAEAWTRTAPRPLGNHPLRMVYLGYMRADKGFFFLLDALDILPDQTLSRLHLTVAARKGPAQVMARLRALGQRLAGLKWHDGYVASSLDQIVAEADIGIVPPLWEDNLPQVALELHARHIPLITSDRGGAQELPGSRDLVFRAGDIQDFARVLARVLSGQVDMAGYWENARIPTGIAEHAQELEQLYKGAR